MIRKKLFAVIIYVLAYCTALSACSFAIQLKLDSAIQNNKDFIVGLFNELKSKDTGE